MLSLRLTFIFVFVALSAAAQPVVVDFNQAVESVPLGTPVDQLRIPRVAIRLLGPATGAWVVAEVGNNLPAGVKIEKAKGRALICESKGGSVSDWDCPAIALEFLSKVSTFSATVGSYGCTWRSTLDGSTGHITTCFMNNHLPDGSQPRIEFTVCGKPAATVDCIFEKDVSSVGNAGNFFNADFANGNQVGVFPGETHTYLVDNLVVTLEGGPCPFGDFVKLLPPFGPSSGVQYFGYPSFDVNAGQTSRVTWEPVPFSTSATYRGLEADHPGWNVPLPPSYNNPALVAWTILKPDATFVDLTPPQRKLGDWYSDVTIGAAQTCDPVVSNPPNPSNSTYVKIRFLVHDRPEPLRIDSVSPSIAKPGSTLKITGAGFVGVPKAVSGLHENPEAFTGESVAPPAPQALDNFLPPGDIVVLIGGQPAATAVVSSSEIRAVVPPLFNGPADISIRTVYGQTMLPGATGFIVGQTPPRARAVRH